MAVKILKFLTMFAVGGTERQFTYVTRNLNRSAFDVRVGCLARKGEFLKDIEALNIPVSEYPIRSVTSAGTLRRQWTFARDLRREGVRLVHAYGFYPNVFSIPAAKLAGCATIASVRDTGAFSDRAQLKTLLQKTACRMADRVVANSAAVRGWLISLGIDERSIVSIPNGIPVSDRRPDRRDFTIRRELGISLDAPVVAVVCRLNKNKGIEYFLHAAAAVSRRIPDARFIIAGASLDPAYQASLLDLAAALGLQNHAIFTGQRNDIPKLLQEVNLSVLPSLTEGLSNSLLEAMAASLPVVATRVGGNPELVHDEKTGLLVPARDPEALAAAMIRILASPEMARRFGQAGFERARDHFSLDATVRRTEELYMEVLSRSS